MSLLERDQFNFGTSDTQVYITSSQIRDGKGPEWHTLDTSANRTWPGIEQNKGQIGIFNFSANRKKLWWSILVVLKWLYIIWAGDFGY